MEIVISIWILWALAVGLIICYFTHARLINNLKSTVDKQHQYIDKILAFNKTQSVVNKDLVDISKDIANKVISIEERVDNLYKSSE